MKHQLLVIINLLMSCIALQTQAQVQPIKFTVATDGTGNYSSIQTAINACPDNERSIIFIKNGTYDEQISLGSKSSPSKKIISLIGESYGNVIITHEQYRASSGTPTFEDICTVKIYGTDFYAENITIQNLATAGMAEALYTASDRATFKNCRILGYQDTFRSKKGTRAYFKNSFIQGAVDFIYAGGTIFFDDCTINCVKGGGYIVAPEDTYKNIPATSTTSGKNLNLEFIFRNCTITANSDVADNSYYLGRPWNANSGAYYLNCKLGTHIRAAGWQTMSGNESSASFAEYNSMDISGNKINTSGRVSWSFQLTKEDAENLLTPSNVYAILNTTVYDPISICIAPDDPQTIINDNLISWNSVPNAIGYLIYKDGRMIATTSNTNFSISSAGNYSVKSINSYGVISENKGNSTSNKEYLDNKIKFRIINKKININQTTKIELYSSKGEIVFKQLNTTNANLSHIDEGIYILKLTDIYGNAELDKIIL